MKASWRTTLTGVLTIMMAVGNAVISYLKTKTLPDMAVTITAITSGIGLINARDNVVTSEQAGAITKQ